MRKLSIFNFITLNGYFKGIEEDISWHQHGGEENTYSTEMLASGNTLLFGRITYEMMKSFWPTPEAKQSSPVVAAGMNQAEKIVFSRTLQKADWNNTTLIRENIIEKVKEIKQTKGKDLTLLGSGTIVSQFAEAGLIDEYQIMVDPIAIGEGKPIFKGIKNHLQLRLTDAKVFKSGVVLLCYKPI